MEGHKEIAVMLIKSKADPNAKDSQVHLLKKENMKGMLILIERDGLLFIGHAKKDTKMLWECWSNSVQISMREIIKYEHFLH
jgi:hypothetical protein